MKLIYPRYAYDEYGDKIDCLATGRFVTVRGLYFRVGDLYHNRYLITKIDNEGLWGTKIINPTGE